MNIKTTLINMAVQSLSNDLHAGSFMAYAALLTAANQLIAAGAKSGGLLVGNEFHMLTSQQREEWETEVLQTLETQQERTGRFYVEWANMADAKSAQQHLQWELEND